MVNTRKIVHIDEEKCDGCGLCVPSCAEGALKIVNGKARLLADRLCDGLGACLGECPRGAIRIEERPADDYDEAAVHAHLGHAAHDKAAHAGHAHARHAVGGNSGSRLNVLDPTPASQPITPGRESHPHAGGCPGSRLRMLQPAPPISTPIEEGPRASQLRQWPVQLTLVPPSGRLWQDADVLIAADCVPFAHPAFHEKLLAGKTLAIACPKLDDVRPYVHKLAGIFASNPIRSITVAIMEVPCCGGLVRVVEMALTQSGRQDIPLKTIVVGIGGDEK